MMSSQVSDVSVPAHVASASVLFHDPAADVLWRGSVSLNTSDELPWSDCNSLSEHAGATVPADQVAHFLNACRKLGRHPGEVLQEAVLLCFDAVIATAAAQEGAE